MVLFYFIKLLFVNKSLVVAINKIDVRKFEDLSVEDWVLIDGMCDVMCGLVVM